MKLKDLLMTIGYGEKITIKVGSIGSGYKTIYYGENISTLALYEHITEKNKKYLDYKVESIFSKYDVDFDTNEISTRISIIVEEK